MKSRLSSTVWGLVFFVALALFGVLGLASVSYTHLDVYKRQRQD